MMVVMMMMIMMMMNPFTVAIQHYVIMRVTPHLICYILLVRDNIQVSLPFREREVHLSSGCVSPQGVSATDQRSQNTWKIFRPWLTTNIMVFPGLLCNLRSPLTHCAFVLSYSCTFSTEPLNWLYKKLLKLCSSTLEEN